MFTLREMLIKDEKATAERDWTPGGWPCSHLRRAWLLFHGNVQIAEVTDFENFIESWYDAKAVRVYPLELTGKDYGFGTEDAGRPQES